MRLKLLHPVAPVLINQPFGNKTDYYKNNGVNIIGHNGIDFQALDGQPVYASHDGVCYPEIDITGGNGVVIRTLTSFDYDNNPIIQAYYKTIYWHMKKADAVVKTGQHVKAGDLIGYADNTGLSTGSHLHFGLKPQLWNENDWIWYNPEQLNGYLGAIDPQPFLDSPDASPHVFNKNIYVGEESTEVEALQAKLASLGLFNANPTGYYGAITKAAVYQFQLKYVAPKSWGAKLAVAINRGDCVLGMTRAALNNL